MNICYLQFLPQNIQDLVEVLQRGYEEHQSFHEAQQDCEKWLLSMSYRLMSHNTLNVSTLELTNRQIDKHRVGQIHTTHDSLCRSSIARKYTVCVVLLILHLSLFLCLSHTHTLYFYTSLTFYFTVSIFHQVLLREIEDYRLTLDSVSRLGQQLILSNSRSPQLAAAVQAQLTNLEESYLNLQSTAHQIRVSRVFSFS